MGTVPRQQAIPEITTTIVHSTLHTTAVCFLYLNHNLIKESKTIIMQEIKHPLLFLSTALNFLEAIPLQFMSLKFI